MCGGYGGGWGYGGGSLIINDIEHSNIFRRNMLNSLVTIVFKIPKFTSATTFMVVGIFGAKKYNDILIFS